MAAPWRPASVPERGGLPSAHPFPVGRGALPSGPVVGVWFAGLGRSPVGQSGRQAAVTPAGWFP